MRLPGLEGVVVGERKVRDYLLSRSHRTGRSKAAFFAGLGYGESDWRALAEAIVRHASANDVAEVEETPFGVKFVVEGDLDPLHGRAKAVRVIWIVPGARIALIW